MIRLGENVATETSTQRRARLSQGASNQAIYNMVVRALTQHEVCHGTLLDVGCGAGNLFAYVESLCERYVGVDVVKYDAFPTDVEFRRLDLDLESDESLRYTGDVVVAVETIEHLENPRDFMRNLTQLTKPGGWAVVTTPNQLSLLSKLTLLTKNEFNAFRDNSYPAHLTALLEVDLRRMASECGWRDVHVYYSLQGRMAGTGRHLPRCVSRMWPREFSDNILIMGRTGELAMGGEETLS